MPFKMVYQLPLAVNTQMVVVNASWYRGPLEMEQLEMLLSELAPVLSRLQHPSDKTGIIASYGHKLVSAVVLVVGVPIVFRHLVVLSHDFLSFLVFFHHFLLLHLHRRILKVLSVFLHPIQWLQLFFRIVLVSLDTVFYVSIFLVFYTADFKSLFTPFGSSKLFALVFLAHLLGFIYQKWDTCLVCACRVRSLLDRRLSAMWVVVHNLFLFGMPFKPAFQPRVFEFAFALFVVQLHPLCHDAC